MWIPGFSKILRRLPLVRRDRNSSNAFTLFRNVNKLLRLRFLIVNDNIRSSGINHVLLIDISNVSMSFLLQSKNVPF